MLLDTDISIALKNHCGQYEIKEISLFELDEVNKYFPNFEIKLNRNKEVNLKLKCPLCDEHHHYSYNVNEILKHDMVIGGCDSLGMPLFFIGNVRKVHQRIKKYNEINKSICAMI